MNKVINIWVFFIMVFIAIGPMEGIISYPLQVKEENDYYHSYTNSYNSSYLIDNMKMVPGELIIQFKENIDLTFSTDNKKIMSTNKDSINILNEAYQVLDIEKKVGKSNTFSSLNIYKFFLANSSDINQAAKNYSKNPYVEYAQPNYIIQTHLVPNDPFYNSSGAWKQSYDDLWGLKKINCEQLWNKTTGNKEITVAIIDTGIDYNHPDIADNIWINEDEIPNNDIDDDHDGFIDNVYGADFSDDDNDPMDRNGHGTHCAGTIAAVGNNNLGVVGMNWHGSIMAIKAILDIGFSESEIIADAIYWAVENGADVISNSWGPSTRNPSNPIIENAVQYAYNAGCIIVFSAGNNNDDVQFYSPQNMKETITVGATDILDKKTLFSNWGEDIDVSAPGINILSLRAKDTDIYGDQHHIVNNDYYRADGTSTSCPFVSGLCSLLLSQNKNLSSSEIKSIICSNVDKVYSSFPIGGRINVNKLLMAEDNVSAFITYPTFHPNLSGEINIIGTAYGDDFKKYIISYQKGYNPKEWIKIKESTNRVQNDMLASLDTSEFDEGPYTLRLQVFCNQGIVTDDSLFIVNNVNDFIMVGDDETADFSSIQKAIDHAGSDDRIFVKSGTYEENILIDRSIRLHGEDRQTTIIRGNQANDIIQIYANDVYVSEFTIEKNQTLTPGKGIVICNAKNNHIFSNTIKNIGFISYFSDLESCILLDNATGNKISANQISDNIAYSIDLLCSPRNSICGNSIDNNSFGIKISTLSNNNSIFGNDLNFNEKIGIQINSSSFNKIIFNNITNNGDGVSLDKNCYHNLLYNNNFIENNVNAFDNGNNTWYDIESKQGNHWNDYPNLYPNSEDKENDGIWDNYYEITGENTNYDPYPLVSSLSFLSPCKPSIFCAQGNQCRINSFCEFTFTSIDPEGQNISYIVDWGDGFLLNSAESYKSGENTQSIQHKWNEIENYKVRVKAVDETKRNSDWSDPWHMMVAKNKMNNHHPVHSFLFDITDRFPFIQSLLVLLLEISTILT